jgi:hypothetical protein
MDGDIFSRTTTRMSVRPDVTKLLTGLRVAFWWFVGLSATSIIVFVLLITYGLSPVRGL